MNSAEDEFFVKLVEQPTEELIQDAPILETNDVIVQQSSEIDISEPSLETSPEHDTLGNESRISETTSEVDSSDCDSNELATFEQSATDIPVASILPKDIVDMIRQYNEPVNKNTRSDGKRFNGHHCVMPFIALKLKYERLKVTFNMIPQLREYQIHVEDPFHDPFSRGNLDTVPNYNLALRLGL